MRLRKLLRGSLLVSVFIFLFQAPIYAGTLNLIERLIYKEVYVMDPNGRETAVLVNRFTDNVEYSWAVDGWIKAPPHLGHCYKNQHSIRSWVDKNRRD